MEVSNGSLHFSESGENIIHRDRNTKQAELRQPGEAANSSFLKSAFANVFASLSPLCNDE